jgi:iron(III) transport system substrate-binding protein
MTHDGPSPLRHRLTIRAMLATLTLCAAIGTGCDRTPAQRVVLYVSADEHVASEIVRDFERETGIVVDMLGDTEAKKTAGLVERLRAEQNNPQADVFWSSECFMTIELAEDGVLDEHFSAATADWPAAHRDGQRRWFGFAARARVIVYAPSRVEADRLPFTWMDLTDARWKNRIVMADPRFGTAGGHLAAMRAYWRRIGLGDAYYEAFLHGLADNHVKLLPTGNAGAVDAVARGEADLGLTDTDDVWAAQANGYDLGIIYPRHHREPDETGGGTLLIPNTVARVKNGPNPAAAAQLIDFLLSEAVERALSESVSHNVPLRPSLADFAPLFAVDDPLDVNLRQAAELREDSVTRAMRILTGDAPEEVPATSVDG